MLTTIHTFKPNTTENEDKAPRIKDYVERIGVVLFHEREDGIYVLMEHIDNPTDDHERRWKFPQGILDETNKHGGFNGRNFLAGYFGLTESEAKLWEVGITPITDPIRSETAVLRKGFRKTITTWAAFKTAPDVELMTEKKLLWVPRQNVLNICDASRIKGYMDVIAMVPTTLLGTSHH